MFGRRNRVDRLEEAFIRNTNLLERVIDVQERQQTSIERLYEEIKGLRTESLRLQRRFFGEDNTPDGNGRTTKTLARSPQAGTN